MAPACAAICEPIWNDYVASLVTLAETGTGRPHRGTTTSAA